MARVAKVESAAQMAGVDVDTMLDDIRTEIARHEIVAEETAGGCGVLAAGDPDAKKLHRELHRCIGKATDDMVAFAGKCLDDK